MPTRRQIAAVQASPAFCTKRYYRANSNLAVGGTGAIVMEYAPGVAVKTTCHFCQRDLSLFTLERSPDYRVQEHDKLDTIAARLREAFGPYEGDSHAWGEKLTDKRYEMACVKMTKSLSSG
jgi:hypothetical protein